MQKLTKTWLDLWPYAMVTAAGVLLGLTAARWSLWPLQARLAALETALLAFHVLEEWRFPGGFHYLYNTLAGSSLPDRYPMNRLSDMWTNTLGFLFGCVCLAAGVTPVLAVMLLLLCCGEVLAHLAGGVLSRKRFRARGKRSIYAPGLATALAGYLPLAAGWVLSFRRETAPSLRQAGMAAGCFLVLMALVLLLPERLCRREDTPYGFSWGAGYFQAFQEEK